MSTLLAVENLTTTFPTQQGEITAVNDITYSIEAGQTLGVVGESGCGKSVTAYSILGLLEYPGRITNGRVIFQGNNLVGKTETELQNVRGDRITMIFQEPMTALNPVLKIGFQIVEQLRRHQTVDMRGAKSRTVEMLELVGIPDPARRSNDYPHQLSGGMRQRAMIAMALICEPDLLIADEPTTALDVTVQAQILDLLQSLQDRLDMTIQFITHDLGVISEITDRVMVMYAGKICEIADTAAVFDAPLHPYTVGLMASIPRPGQGNRRLPSIDGNVPNLLRLPPGCPFQDRCQRVQDRCRRETPQLTEVTTGHKVACFNPMK